MADRRAKLLLDMLDSAAAIQAFTSGRTLAEYGADLMLRSAVERQFEIIGEAMRRLSAEDAAFAGRISRISAIIAFQDLIAHGYDIVDGRIVWGVIEDDLPPFMAEARALLAEVTSQAP